MLLLAAVALPQNLPSPHSRFALGINEAVAIPWRLTLTMPIDKQSAELRRKAAASAALGARFVRGHTGNYPFVSQSALAEDPTRLQQADAWVGAVQAAGLEPVLMVSPWPANDTASYTEHYLPDIDSYARYVQALVERYDGDGIDDMPNLRAPVRYWEADNEPDLKNSRPARSATRTYDPATFCTPEEYAQVFLASEAAIHAAYPEALVLNGGLYKPHTREADAYFARVVAVPGVIEGIQILSVHTYHDTREGERLTTAIANQRRYVPNVPVWVTETAYGQDEGLDVQAEMFGVLVRRTIEAGADKFFWHSLEDKPKDAYPKKLPTMWGYSLLLNVNGVTTTNPVGDAFAALAAFSLAHDLNGAISKGKAMLLRDGTRWVP